MWGETTPKNKIGPIEVAHALVKGSRNENDVFPGGFSGLRAQGSGKRQILGVVYVSTKTMSGSKHGSITTV